MRTYDDVYICGHEALRTRSYDDESWRWEIECRDCGEVRKLTHAEWRDLLVSTAPSRELMEITEGFESGRLSLA
jgi:hypothetical protein